MNKILKWFLIIIGSGFIILIGLFLYALYEIDGIYAEYHTKQELIDNYESKTKEIIQIKDFMNSIVPPNKNVEIEFNGKRKLSIFHIVDHGYYFNNWNLIVASSKTDNLLQKLDWTRETLKEIKDKLDNANCISLESGEPFTIGFKRSGDGEYFYKIFNQTLSDSMQKIYNDSCQYIYYKKNIVLEYGGGVLGVQCFPKK